MFADGICRWSEDVLGTDGSTLHRHHACDGANQGSSRQICCLAALTRFMQFEVSGTKFWHAQIRHAQSMLHRYVRQLSLHVHTTMQA